MKFVTLALAVLLAVGCQAASLQADAPASLPTLLGQIRSGMSVALDAIKVSGHNIGNKINDEETKNAFIAWVDQAHAWITALRQQAEPMTDSAVATLNDATADMRASINTDIQNMKTDLQPKYEELRLVIQKHLDQYRALIEPSIQEYRANEEAQMAALKASLEPKMQELRTLFESNVEETKSRLVPILEAINAKLSEHLENAKTMLGPYVHEYKEQFATSVSNAQNLNYAAAIEKAQVIKEKLKSFAEELAKEFQTLFSQ